MQGEEAVQDLISAIKDFNISNTNIDALIIARGGGSLEDLWCFNSEKLAYEIFKSNIPIVSAIGHETDTTISDLVADKRAGTPSIAAEIIAPSVDQCLQNIDFCSDKIFRLVSNKIESNMNYMNNIKKRHGLHKIKYILSNHSDKLFRIKNQISLDKFKNKINQSLELLDSKYKTILQKANSQMNINYDKLSYYKNLSTNLNPENVVKRGYSIIYKNGKLVKSIKQVDTNDNLDVKLKDGIIETKVFRKKEDKMTDQNNKLTFEEGMKELEKILSKLESDQTPLEEMVDLYEKANKITEICKSRLDQANQRMTKLIKNDNGDLQEVDYEK